MSKLDVLDKLDLEVHTSKLLKWDSEDDNIDFVLQGIIGSDYITTVSRKYAQEIQTPEFGEGLDEILKTRAGRLEGVLNGISYEIFNPSTDSLIKHNYSVADYKSGKKANKVQLCKKLNLDVGDRPVLGVISRLVHQKGLDMVADSLNEIIEMGYQVVILGTGDPQLEMTFQEFNNNSKAKGRYKALITFSEEIAREIYAGSDMFLVPSRYEPCGLTQMIAMKYGSVPVVRGTGGLYDTVEENVTGYVYKNFERRDMLSALKRAYTDYASDQAKWNKITLAAMNKDYSWQESAKKYISLYKKTIDQSRQN